MPLIKNVSGLVLLGALLASAPAQNAPQAAQQELIAADQSIWQAIAGSHPKIDEVRQAMAPDYIDMELGVSHSREDVLKDLQGLTAFSFQYEHARAFVLSPTSGYVIAELSYSSVVNGKTAEGRVLTTTVFSKEHGRWLAHLHTEMDMKPEEKATDPSRPSPSGNHYHGLAFRRHSDRRKLVK